MKRLNFLLIPLFTILVAVSGSIVTSSGMDWYRTIMLPSFTPPGPVIGLVWTVIFILATISALIFWNIHKPWGKLNRGIGFVATIALFIINGILNFYWSFLFFHQHNIYFAVYEAVALDLTVIGLIALIWPKSKWAAFLLLPYALWGAFASFLTWNVCALGMVDIIS
ncbi:MAG: tryptophan-rich sensory protein [bacterium]|nr:tryptophan-rich sensory protein [bacterium]